MDRIFNERKLEKTFCLFFVSILLLFTKWAKINKSKTENLFEQTWKWFNTFEKLLLVLIWLMTNLKKWFEKHEKMRLVFIIILTDLNRRVRMRNLLCNEINETKTVYQKHILSNLLSEENYIEIFCIHQLNFIFSFKNVNIQLLLKNEGFDAKNRNWWFGRGIKKVHSPEKLA